MHVEGQRPPPEGVWFVHTLAVCTRRACAVRSSSLPTVVHGRAWSGAVWSWRATRAGLGLGHTGDNREARRDRCAPANVRPPANRSSLLLRLGTFRIARHRGLIAARIFGHRDPPCRHFACHFWETEALSLESLSRIAERFIWAGLFCRRKWDIHIKAAVCP